MLPSAALFAALAAPAPAAAPPGFDRSTVTFDFWTENQGLPQATIRTMVQTRDGYLWLGTTGGLLRFDGVGFERFAIQTGELLDNEVRTIVEDDEGNLWVGTFGGGIAVSRKGRFTPLTTADGLADNVVRRIRKDPQGALWAATGNGISRFAGGPPRTYGPADGLDSAAIADLLVAADGSIVAATKSAVHRLSGERFERIEGVVQPADGNVMVLAEARDGGFWIGFDSGTIKRYRAPDTTTFHPDRQEVEEIYDLREDGDGALWIASLHGLARLADGRFQTVRPKYGPFTLSLARSLFTDREESFWVGTEKGLVRMRPSPLSAVTVEDGLPDDTVRAVAEDASGAIWIATAKGLARLQDGVVSAVLENGKPIPACMSVATGAKGEVWIASGRRLLAYRQGQVVNPFPAWPGPPGGIRSLAVDAGGRLWAGTYSDGLVVVEGGRLRTFRTEDGLCTNALRHVRPDDRGGAWIATFGAGVCRYEDGRFRALPETQGMGASHAMHTAEDESGAMWIATRGGVLRLKDGRLSRITERDGLASSYVYRIQDDGQGRFWFPSALGLFWVSQRELNDFADGRIGRVTSVHYGIKDGMKSNVCTVALQPGGARTRDGRLLFSTLGGMVVVSQREIEKNRRPPPVAIASVRIDGRAADLSRPVEADPGEGTVEIQYAGLSYLSPDKVRFRYRLEGADRDWVEAGTRRFAHYAHLRAGDYRFRVMACNADGVWTEGEAAYAFRIRPHFYETVPFFVLVAIGVVFAVGAVFRLQARRARLREEELAARVKEAVAQVKLLGGLLPICAACKKIRDDTGYWANVETYISDHTDANFSHGICPDCMVKLYPDFVDAEAGSSQGN